MIGQQLVADVMEIADKRHIDAHLEEAIANMGHGGGRLVPIDRDAHDLGAGAGEIGNLPGRCLDIGRVGVGHGLNDNRGMTAHDHGALSFTDPHGHGRMAWCRAAAQGADRVEGHRLVS